MTKPTLQPVQYITISEEYAEQRIDNFLMTYLKSLPKTRLYRLLRKGEIRVNKKRTAPSYRLQTDDVIRLPPMALEEKTAPKVPGKRSIEMLTDRILYEDAGLFIINKPPGLPVHGGKVTTMGVVETLRAMFPAIKHLELAHRLDADTSGCLILAKKRSVLRELHQLMREGSVHKVYLALTKGHWKPEEYRVDAPLLKNFLAGGERIVKVDPEGKTALTEFEPVQTYGKAMLVKATLHTGRTHQIRVHARYRQHPIAGDEKYGDREFNKMMREQGLKRLFLHAHLLEFTLPSTGKTISITAPLADDLQECLDQYSKAYHI